MKNLRKITVCLLAFVMCMGVICFTGCAIVREGKMEELVGTYQLTEYVRIMNDATEDKEATKEDLLKNNGIEMFLVVTGNAIGYLSYKDNETEFFVREVKITYTFDQEKPDMVETIGYEFGGQSRNDLKSYMGMLGFLSGKKALNNTNAKYESSSSGCTKKHDDKIYFEKVSKDIDTKYIENKYGTINIESYAKSSLLGKFFQYDDYGYEEKPTSRLNDYIYLAFELDKYEDKADVYYATKSEKTQQSKTGVAVAFVYSEDRTKIEKMTIDGITYIVNFGMLSLENPNAEENGLNFIGFSSIDDKTNHFQYYIDQYEQYLAQQENS